MFSSTSWWAFNLAFVSATLYFLDFGSHASSLYLSCYCNLTSWSCAANFVLKTGNLSATDLLVSLLLNLLKHLFLKVHVLQISLEIWLPHIFVLHGWDNGSSISVRQFHYLYRKAIDSFSHGECFGNRSFLNVSLCISMKSWYWTRPLYLIF